MGTSRRARAPGEPRSDAASGERARSTPSAVCEHGVREAYLFGSVARGEARPGSDIDIAVAGCPAQAFYRLASKLERTLDLPLDLIDLDAAPADFAQPIRELGVRLYPPARAENCLSRVAHGIDESVPTGNESHRLLIDQLSEAIPELRPALLSRELAARIDSYRRFRHAFRHMYFFDLEWARLSPLAAGVPALLADFDVAIDALLSHLGG